MSTKPGDTIQETIDTIGITQTDLAHRMGRPIKTINEIIHGRAQITAQTAIELEKALGPKAEFWMALESEYRIALARKRGRK